MKVEYQCVQQYQSIAIYHSQTAIQLEEKVVFIPILYNVVEGKVKKPIHGLLFQQIFC